MIYNISKFPYCYSQFKNKICAEVLSNWQQTSLRAAAAAAATTLLQMRKCDLCESLICCCHFSCTEVRGGAMAAADGARGSRVPAGEAVRGGVLRGTAQWPRPLQGSQPRQSRCGPQGACQMPNKIVEKMSLLFVSLITFPFFFCP